MQVSSFDTLPTPSPAYVPSPTAELFIRATTEGPVNERRMLILMGPRGTGKTTAATVMTENVSTSQTVNDFEESGTALGGPPTIAVRLGQARTVMGQYEFLFALVVLLLLLFARR